MIKILCVGKIKEQYLVDGIKEYKKRMESWKGVEIVEVKECINNIRYNRTLKHISFYDNQLQNESGSSFVELLVHNKTLQTVNVGFNRIQMKCIDEINKRLKENVQRQKEKYLPNLVPSK